MVLQKLPPLGSLEAFVVVGQRQSLKAAAPELNISVSALSRRIQSLERLLGLVLFERGAREFRLTSEGAALFESVCASLDMLGESIASLKPSSRRSVLRIGAPAGFASYWLAPRIGMLKAAQPLLDIVIELDVGLDRLGAGVDAVVLVGEEEEFRSNDRYLITRLRPLRVRALCAPGLMEALGGVMAVDDLETQTVLATRSHSDWFGDWRRGVGALIRPHRVEYYDAVPPMLDAAANGLGLAIVPELLAPPHLVSGRLVDPFGASVDTRSSYYLAALPADAELELVQRFELWLLRELTRDFAAVDIDASVLQTPTRAHGADPRRET